MTPLERKKNNDLRRRGGTKRPRRGELHLFYGDVVWKVLPVTPGSRRPFGGAPGATFDEIARHFAGARAVSIDEARMGDDNGPPYIGVNCLRSWVTGEDYGLFYVFDRRGRLVEARKETPYT